MSRDNLLDNLKSKLSRRNFLRSAPLAAAATPVAISEAARSGGLRAAGLGRSIPPMGVGSSFEERAWSPEANNRYAQAQRTIFDRSLQKLRRGEIPKHMRNQVEDEIELVALHSDIPGIDELKSISKVCRLEMKRRWARRAVIQRKIKYIEHDLADRSPFQVLVDAVFNGEDVDV